MRADSDGPRHATNATGAKVDAGQADRCQPTRPLRHRRCHYCRHLPDRIEYREPACAVERRRVVAALAVAEVEERCAACRALSAISGEAA